MIRCPASCRSDIAGSAAAGRGSLAVAAGRAPATLATTARFAAAWPATWRAAEPACAAAPVIPLAFAPPRASAPPRAFPARAAGRCWVPGEDGRPLPAAVLVVQPATTARAAGIRTQD